MNTNIQYSHKNNENFINEIKQKLTFEDVFTNPKFLADLGISKVELDKAKSSVNSKQYHIEDSKFGASRIVIYPNASGNKNGFPFFSNQTNERDRGDIFQFVKNRTDDPFKVILSATNNLDGHIDIKEREKEVKKIKPFDFKEYLNKGLVTSQTIVERGMDIFLRKNRGISFDVMNHPLFLNKVMFYNHKEGKGNEFNAFFPKTNTSNEVVGAEIKFPERTATGMKDMIDGNPLCLWHSNLPEKIEKVVLVESAIDALSHYQIHQDDYVFYVSSNGNLYEKRIESFYQLLKDFSIPDDVPIVLANDNDFAGFQYDVRMINHSIEKLNSVFSVESLNDTVNLKFHSQSEKGFLEEVKDYFEKIKLSINDLILSEQYQSMDFVKLETNDNDQSVVLKFSKKEFQNHHRKLSLSLVKGLDFVKSKTRLEIEKPPISTNNSIKDWNDYVQIQNIEQKNNYKQNSKRSQSNNKGSGLKY